MAAAYTNLYVEQGVTYTTVITLDDVYGNLYNLTQMVAAGTIRKSYYSANSTAVFSTAINSTAGTITLALSSEATANIAPGRYVYDTIITIVDPQTGITNLKTRILEGVLEVSPSVTH